MKRGRNNFGEIGLNLSIHLRSSERKSVEQGLHMELTYATLPVSVNVSKNNRNFETNVLFLVKCENILGFIKLRFQKRFQQL